MKSVSAFRSVIAVCLLAIYSTAFGQAIPPRLYSVEVSAAIELFPPKITLSWPADPNATSYSISKPSSSGQWALIGTISGAATQFIDTNVRANSRTEYQVLKATNKGYSGSGYILVGTHAPGVETRGKIILLVDSRWANTLATELRRLEQDLVGDGWTVLRQNIAPTTPVPQVKAAIQSFYYSDPARVRALFLFGHIPVPYSGDFTADSHLNHRGAWPADVYYADMNGQWTDSSVTSLYGEKSWNHNVPGDGKFDQSELPSDVELEVGRVDLSNLTCFANKSWSRNEEFLLRQYLEKDHRFRHGKLPLPRRGLVIDNFGADAEALASTGWRAFAPMFGAANTTEIYWGTFFSTLSNEGYLWSYGNGGGGYFTCAGIGTSDDFAIYDIKTVFTFFFGSYYGDWDNESNFLRAPLGSTTYTLTSTYASRPHWFVHPMALGETIGATAKLTQNNSARYQPMTVGTRQVHTALHGDPTLRMHPVIPPSNVTATAGSGVTLSWNASTDSNVYGYYVFRANNELGPFTRITLNPVTSTRFTDSAGTLSSVYMVRTLKLEATGSGTYYNLSQGIFARPANPPAAPSALTATFQSSAIALSWADNSADEHGFRVYRSSNGTSYSAIATTGPNTRTYLDSSASTSATNHYVVAAFNSIGESLWSDPVTLTPLGSTAATFVRSDSTTLGSWKGVYGSQGYNVIQAGQNYPAYVNVAAAGASSWTWNSSTTDPSALLRPGDSSRLAACWYSNSGFDLQLWFSDDLPHRVSLYFLDWDQAGRRQVLEILHASSGAILASRTIENFQNGVYVTFDMRGRVTMRIRPLAGNVVLSGLFFDPAVAQVAAPSITPPGGSFTSATSATLACATSGASIHYTLNGTEPTMSSPVYTAPLTISSTTTLKARAFKSGLAASDVSSATFTIGSPDSGSSVTFNGVNTTRGGTWKGSIGTQGHIIVRDSQTVPSYLSTSASGKADWTWADSTSDARALQRAGDSTRLATCWYSSAAFEVALNFTDAQVHRVSFYCLDWDRANRQQRVEILDYKTRQVLHTYSLSNFGAGVYLDYTVKGPVIARFTRVASHNAVLSGIFFDGAN